VRTEEGQGKGAGTKSKRERFQWLPFINHPQDTHPNERVHVHKIPTTIQRFIAAWALRHPSPVSG